MLAFGMQRSFMHILIGSGLFNVVAIGPFAYFLGATGASISVFLTEFILKTAVGVGWSADCLARPAVVGQLGARRGGERN
jgi:O-antigen/teichoic acid export membrane protein